MNHKRRPIPEAIARLQRQLDQFRNSQSQRTKLPEPLWQAAVELARQHGVYAVAHPLRLDYMGLRRRLAEATNSALKATSTAFVELIGPPPPTAHPEWLIEFESLRGAKMRIHWKAAAPPDWASLLCAWRDTER